MTKYVNIIIILLYVMNLLVLLKLFMTTGNDTDKIQKRFKINLYAPAPVGVN